ncbi:uncharacterized protein LOC128558110 [Mercenaria mercenaria]|uniref:uncharacterized protein LOC128558110 n=1 Tax=Mercenaria mercenaria TaxID=6596 RepID=UPI00234F5452|nr:uncharacterized protein LOC128558110 [Mercenaria mercenaria]
MATGGSDKCRLSDETFDLLCTVCKRKGKNTEAEKYCVDCGDYYCLTCVKVHDDVPLLTGHKILGKGQFQSMSTGKQPPVPTERCDKHSHKHVDMYCQNHDDVGCSTCMAIEHRLCQDIFYIPDFIQNNARIVNPKNIQQELETSAKILDEYLDDFQQERQQILKSKADSIEEIRKFRQEINARLDEIEQNSVADTENRYKVLIKEIEDRMKLLLKNKASITSAKDKYASARSNVSQEFVNGKKGRKVARNAKACVEDSKAGFHRKDIKIIPDQIILPMLKEMNMLLKVAEKDSLLQAKNKKTPTVKIPSDTHVCNITSVCYLEDGSLILCDNNNKKLKHLDSSSYTVREYYDLPCFSWQVCPINKQEVAVSVYMKKEIHLISHSNKMRKTNEIKTDFECRGLAHADGNLYISDKHTSVYVYSVSGRKLKCISMDPSGQFKFNLPRLAVNKDGSKMYITCLNNGLIILDNNGQVVRKFNGPELQNPCGIFQTSSGSLLVASAGSSNVLQFGPTGQLIGEVIKPDDGKRGCQVVACNQQMTKMIICRLHDNNIEVYDII